MAHKNKIKGNRFEYEVRDMFIDKGINAKRAYASDGRSLGYTEDVDVLVTHNDTDYPLQCKRRKALSKVIIPSDNVFAQVVRADRGDTLAIIKLDKLIELINNTSDIQEGARSKRPG